MVALRKGVWWSLGAACLSAPPLLAKRTSGSATLLFVLAVTAVGIALAIGSSLGSNEMGDSAKIRSRVSTACVFAGLYPLAVVLGVLLAGTDNGVESLKDRLLWIAGGAVVGSVPTVGSLLLGNPSRLLRCLSWIWFGLFGLTFFVYGLGFVFLPLAISLRVASK